MTQQSQYAQQQANRLCADNGITIHPYGNAWWLLGKGVNRVVGNLAGLSLADIAPMPVRDRKN